MPIGHVPLGNKRVFVELYFTNYEPTILDNLVIFVFNSRILV